MFTSEQEMIRKLNDTPDPDRPFTSLQPTYEDTVPPDPEEDWTFDE